MTSVCVETPRNESARLARLPYALTIFLSAFLLFEVQPLIGKYLLPWFGGVPAVWTTCLLFFQVFLLGGYVYAHLIINRLSWRAQKRLHLLLLAASLILLAYQGHVWSSPVTPGSEWKPNGWDNPTWHILGLLGMCLGLPYFALSSTGPLLQGWFDRRHPGGFPYRLYALSNLGSLMALLSYPFLVEPMLSLTTQARLWSWGYVGFALCSGYCAAQVGERRASEPASLGGISISNQSSDPPEESAPPSKRVHALWLSLAACASVMLLATTNQMCQEVAAIPFLWVLPLSLYLLSFVICFHNDRWYRREWFHLAFGLALVLICFVLYRAMGIKLLGQIVAYSFTLFASCMVCHGELVRLKPSPRHLTSFYLMVASGGALGGVFVSLLAPHLFRGYWEYHLALWGSALLAFMVLVQDKTSWLYQSRPWVPVLLVVTASLLPVCIALALESQPVLHDWRIPLMVAVAIALVVKVLVRTRREATSRTRPQWAQFCAAATLALLGGTLFVNTRPQTMVTLRNFYGVLTVVDTDVEDPEWHAYTLRHGQTVHGFQYLAEAKRREPTCYYARSSGVGLAWLHHPRRTARLSGQESLRVGVVGLGVGTLAAYGQPGDYIRFYEINPAVIGMANQNFFTYLSNCPARVDVIPGDARISLEQEWERTGSQQFDLLAIDAFNGDAIPVHLLTKEAFEIYLKHLRKPDGILALHISNRALDLSPVVRGQAEHFKLGAVRIIVRGEDPMVYPSTWMLITENRQFLSLPAIAEASTPLDKDALRIRLWTDDYSNLFQVLKKK